MNWSSSTGDPFIYWSFYVLLVLILTYCGWGISNDDEKQTHFRKYAWIAGTSYSLIEGLRWLRGADYYHYYMDLDTNFKASVCTLDPEPIYKWWVNLFYMTGLHPSIAFIFYSALLIFGILLIFKSYPKAALWGLPLFFLMTNSQTENIVRQTLATSFLIYAYVAYLNDKKKLMFAMLCVVPLIHTAGLFGVALFLIFTYIKVPLKQPWILVALFLFAYYFWNPDWFQGFADFLSKLNLGDDIKGQGYLDNSDRWFTSEGAISNVLGQKAVQLSILCVSASFLVKLFTIWFGFYACRDERKMQTVYYFAYVALMIQTIAGDIELFTRFSNWTNLLTPILIGIMFAKLKLPQIKNLQVAIYVVFAINYIFYGLIRSIGSLPYAGCGFIWDK
jgi:hypothetical protein